MYNQPSPLSSRILQIRGATLIEYILVIVLLGFALVAFSRFVSPAISTYHEEQRGGGLQQYYPAGLVTAVPTATPQTGPTAAP